MNKKVVFIIFKLKLLSEFHRHLKIDFMKKNTIKCFFSEETPDFSAVKNSGSWSGCANWPHKSPKFHRRNKFCRNKYKLFFYIYFAHFRYFATQAESSLLSASSLIAIGSQGIAFQIFTAENKTRVSGRKKKLSFFFTNKSSLNPNSNYYQLNSFFP